MDGKVLRGTLDEAQNGTYLLLAAYLPSEGVVLMEVELEGKGCEIPGALKLLKRWIYVRKWSWAMPCTPKEQPPCKLSRQAVITSGSPKATNRNWKKMSACSLNPSQSPCRDMGVYPKISRPSKKPAKGMAGWKNGHSPSAAGV